MGSLVIKAHFLIEMGFFVLKRCSKAKCEVNKKVIYVIAFKYGWVNILNIRFTKLVWCSFGALLVQFLS